MAIIWSLFGVATLNFREGVGWIKMSCFVLASIIFSTGTKNPVIYRLVAPLNLGRGGEGLSLAGFDVVAQTQGYYLVFIGVA